MADLGTVFEQILGWFCADLGNQFWEPILGTNFGNQFWEPVLGTNFGLISLWISADFGMI
jgi:hypothetical protein